MKYKILFIGFLLCFSVLAQTIPEKPQGYVSQYGTSILNQTEVNRLEGLCRTLDQQGVAQVVIAIFDTYGELTPEDFTIQLAEKWKIGHKDKDNGLIIAVFMKEKKIRFEVGYGLEGDLTDARSIMIIQKVISPYFKQGQFYKGLRAGLQEVAKTLTGEYIGSYTPPKRKKNDSPLGFIIFIILIIIFQMLFGRRGRGRTIGSRGTYWGGFGGFGGSSGGGFSGGGGSFGGGGATGGW